jgi:hypothetical protein
MMKMLPVLCGIMLWTFSSAHAATLLYEDFQGNVDDNITTLSWTNLGGWMVVKDNELVEGSGYSAYTEGWAVYSKALSPTPNYSDPLTLTGLVEHLITLSNTETYFELQPNTGDAAWIRLQGTGMDYHVAFGHGSSQSVTSGAISEPDGTVFELRLVYAPDPDTLSGDYRLAGDPNWIPVGVLNNVAFEPNEVILRSLSAGWRYLDEITVFEGSPTPIPEPATLFLLATGALGLLGYGWKRRRRG